MLKDYNSLELICIKWMPLAQEYAKFLNRYNLNTLTIVTSEKDIGYNMAVFADGAEYLRLSLEDSQFSSEEKKLDELFKVIESLYTVLFNEEYYNNEEYEDYYEDDVYCDSEYEEE